MSSQPQQPKTAPATSTGLKPVAPTQTAAASLPFPSTAQTISAPKTSTAPPSLALAQSSAQPPAGQASSGGVSSNPGTVQAATKVTSAPNSAEYVKANLPSSQGNTVGISQSSASLQSSSGPAVLKPATSQVPTSSYASASNAQISKVSATVTSPRPFVSAPLARVSVQGSAVHTPGQPAVSAVLNSPSSAASGIAGQPLTTAISSSTANSPRPIAVTSPAAVGSKFVGATLPGAAGSSTQHLPSQITGSAVSSYASALPTGTPTGIATTSVPQGTTVAQPQTVSSAISPKSYPLGVSTAQRAVSAGIAPAPLQTSMPMNATSVPPITGGTRPPNVVTSPSSSKPTYAYSPVVSQTLLKSPGGVSVAHSSLPSTAPGRPITSPATGTTPVYNSATGLPATYTNIPQSSIPGVSTNIPQQSSMPLGAGSYRPPVSYSMQAPVASPGTTATPVAGSPTSIKQYIPVPGVPTGAVVPPTSYAPSASLSYPANVSGSSVVASRAVLNKTPHSPNVPLSSTSTGNFFTPMEGSPVGAPVATSSLPLSSHPSVSGYASPGNSSVPTGSPTGYNSAVQQPYIGISSYAARPGTAGRPPAAYPTTHFASQGVPTIPGNSSLVANYSSYGAAGQPVLPTQGMYGTLAGQKRHGVFMKLHRGKKRKQLAPGTSQPMLTRQGAVTVSSATASKTGSTGSPSVQRVSSTGPASRASSGHPKSSINPVRAPSALTNVSSHSDAKAVKGSKSVAIWKLIQQDRTHTAAPAPTQSIRSLPSSEQSIVVENKAKLGDIGSQGFWETKLFSASKSTKLNDGVDSFTPMTVDRILEYKPSFVLHLFPGGFSVDSHAELYPFDRKYRSFLEDIDRGRMPLDSMMDFPGGSQLQFYDGCLIVEIKDYRRCNTKHHGASTTRVLVKPDHLSLQTDVEHSRLSHNLDENDCLELEKALINDMKYPVCLDPSPEVSRIMNVVQITCNGVEGVAFPPARAYVPKRFFNPQLHNMVYTTPKDASKLEQNRPRNLRRPQGAPAMDLPRKPNKDSLPGPSLPEREYTADPDHNLENPSRQMKFCLQHQVGVNTHRIDAHIFVTKDKPSLWIMTTELLEFSRSSSDSKVVAHKSTHSSVMLGNAKSALLKTEEVYRKFLQEGWSLSSDSKTTKIMNGPSFNAHLTSTQSISASKTADNESSVLSGPMNLIHSAGAQKIKDREQARLDRIAAQEAAEAERVRLEAEAREARIRAEQERIEKQQKEQEEARAAALAAARQASGTQDSGAANTGIQPSAGKSVSAGPQPAGRDSGDGIKGDDGNPGLKSSDVNIAQQPSTSSPQPSENGPAKNLLHPSSGSSRISEISQGNEMKSGSSPKPSDAANPVGSNPVAGAPTGADSNAKLDSSSEIGTTSSNAQSNDAKLGIENTNSSHAQNATPVKEQPSENSASKNAASDDSKLSGKNGQEHSSPSSCVSEDDAPLQPIRSGFSSRADSNQLRVGSPKEANTSASTADQAPATTSSTNLEGAASSPSQFFKQTSPAQDSKSEPPKDSN